MICSRLGAGGLLPNDGRKDDDAQDALDYAVLRKALELKEPELSLRQAKLVRNGREKEKKSLIPFPREGQRRCEIVPC